MLTKLDHFHKTRSGLLMFGLVELILTYVSVSLALAHGFFLWYLLTLIFLVGTLQNFIHLIWSFFRGKR